MESLYLIYRAAYDKLANAAIQARACRWPVRPKAHFYEHLIFDYRGSNDQCLNGRYCQNYLCEDLMRRVKEIAVGSHPAFLSKHVVFKYCLQMTLQWR